MCEVVEGIIPALHHIRDLDDLLLDGVLHQLRLVMNVELAHQVELMRLDGLFMVQSDSPTGAYLQAQYARMVTKRLHVSNDG